MCPPKDTAQGNGLPWAVLLYVVACAVVLWWIATYWVAISVVAAVALLVTAGIAAGLRMMSRGRHVVRYWNPGAKPVRRLPQTSPDHERREPLALPVGTFYTWAVQPRREAITAGRQDAER